VLAYIDAGSGSLLIQAVIAAIVSVPFFFRRNFAAVVQRLRRPKVAERAKAADPTAEAK
jgi:hypothetical protein